MLARDPMVDILAIGYGEFLVPHLVDWMYNGYEQLTSPPQGKLLKTIIPFFYSAVHLLTEILTTYLHLTGGLLKNITTKALLRFTMKV